MELGDFKATYIRLDWGEVRVQGWCPEQDVEQERGYFIAPNQYSELAGMLWTGKWYDADEFWHLARSAGFSKSSLGDLIFEKDI